MDPPPLVRDLGYILDCLIRAIGYAPYFCYSKGMSKVIQVDPEVMGGTPVFQGTRVPVQTLFDYIEGKETIDEFLEDFPSVKKDQVIQLLEELKKQALRNAA